MDFYNGQSKNSHEASVRNQELCHALAFNRAKTKQCSSSLLLDNTSQAFDRYYGDEYNINRQAAIYQLFLNERESFVKCIVNRT